VIRGKKSAKKPVFPARARKNLAQRDSFNMPTFPLDILVEKSGLTEAEIQTRFSVPVD
jgi:hypothetical protein